MTQPWRDLLIAALIVGVMAAIAAGGFLLMRQSFTVWRSELAEAQAAATASREERARQAQEAEEADRRAASIPAVPQPARGFDPLARRAGGFSPLAPTSGRPAETEDAVPTNPEFGDLPDTLGVETVFFQCTWCHSAAVFTQQRMSAARWDYTLDWMLTQGMPELDPEDRAVVLDYLVRHFGPAG